MQQRPFLCFCSTRSLPVPARGTAPGQTSPGLPEYFVFISGPPVIVILSPMESPYMLFGICIHPSKLSFPPLTSSSTGTYSLCVADSIMSICEGRSTLAPSAAKHHTWTDLRWSIRVLRLCLRSTSVRHYITDGISARG